MLWALAAFLGNIIEQLMIGSVIRDMNPIFYGAIFYTFSLASLTTYSFFIKKDQQFFDFDKALKYKWLVLCFAGGAMIGNILFFCSLYLLGVGMTAFLLVFIRVLVTVYAYVYMKDRFPADKIIAFTLGIAMLLVFSFSQESLNIWGIAMALLSCFGFALESISRKKLAENNLRPENMMLFRNTMMFTAFWLIAGAAMLLGLVENAKTFDITLQSLGLIIAAAILGGTLVNIFAFHAMKTVKLSQYQAIETTKPVILAFLAVAILGEEITIIQWGAGAIIVLSAFYFLAPSKPKPPIKPIVP